MAQEPPGGSIFRGVTRFGTLFDPTVARRAAIHLQTRDERLAAVIERHGPLQLPRRRAGGAFGYMVRTVVFQQLSTASAQAIHQRVVGALGRPRRGVTPDAILSAGQAGLAALGLSAPKRRALLELAHQVECGAFAPDELDRLPDELVRERIVARHGFGAWSAEMFLIFRLGRCDVLPATDLAIRSNLAELFAEPVDDWPAERVREHGENWRPFRSAAAWWLWRMHSVGLPGDDGLDRVPQSAAAARHQRTKGSVRR